MSISTVIGKVEEGETAAVKTLIAEFNNIKTKAEADLQKADGAIRAFINHIISKAGGDPAKHAVNLDTGEVVENPQPEAAASTEAEKPAE